MKWLQVTGYPQYYVNELFEVKRVFDDGSVTTYTANIPHVVLRKKGRPPCTARKRRLYYLTTQGIDPYLAKHSDIEVIEIEGSLKVMSYRERRVLTTKQADAKRRLSNNKRHWVWYFELGIQWNQACLMAIAGDTNPLWSVLKSVRPEIDGYVRHQLLVRSETMRNEVIDETFTTYVERVVSGRTGTTNTRALKRLAKGVYQQIKNS